MSDAGSESTNPESFELINDVTSNQRNERILISNTPSYASTECADDLNISDEDDDLKMEANIDYQTQTGENLVINSSTTATTAPSTEPLQQTIQSLEDLNSNLLGNVNENNQHTLQQLTVSNSNLTVQTTKATDQINKTETEATTNNIEQDTDNKQVATKSATENETEQITFSKPTTPKPTKNSSPSNPMAGTLTGNLFGWLAENEFLHRVAEKAISSVDTVITTLDPGMKEVLFAGGDINVQVTSNNDLLIGGVRDAFLDVFKRATIKGIESQPQLAVQLVGVESAKQAAALRLIRLRENISVVPQNQVILVMESFLQEHLPNRWFEITYLMIDDPSNQLQLMTFSQATPIELDYVNYLKFETPEDYPFKAHGYAVPVGQLINERLNWVDDDWHLNYAGIERRQIIYNATISLAHQYKQKLKR